MIAYVLADQAMESSELYTSMDPHLQLQQYDAVISSVRPYAGLDKVLELLQVAASLARRIKQHSQALRYHREMLALRGQAGAIPESFLLLWTEIATDLQSSGRYTEALSALSEAENQLKHALSDQGMALLYKQQAFLHDCNGQYRVAIDVMQKARGISDAEPHDQILDDMLRHRTMIIRALAATNGHVRDSGRDSGTIAESEQQRLRQQSSQMADYLLAHGPWRDKNQMPHQYIAKLGSHARPWHDDVVGAFPQLHQLISALREATPSLRKEYRSLRRQR